MKQDRLTVPVYLNQRIVFDLLAMTEDGISTVKSVSSREQYDSKSELGSRGSFGLSNALSSLLSVNIGASISEERGKKNEETTKHEKIHTPSSLFYKLRQKILDRGELNFIESECNVSVGDIVEFSATLSRNPFVETLDSMIEMVKLGEIFEEKPQSIKGKRNQNNQTKLMINQIEAIVESIKNGNTVDLKANLDPGSMSAVIVIDIEYLNDPQMADIVDGTFKVMGKVTRLVEDENDSINLLRKTPLRRMPSDLFGQTFGMLGLNLSESGFEFPDLDPSIKGPAIQVIPIAIYS